MGWEPAGARRGDSGSAGSPGSRGGSSDNPRDPSPHRDPARALPLLPPPALVPRLVPGPAGQPQRRLGSHHRMARARLRRRPPGRAARPQRSRARRGPRPLPAAVGCPPGSFMAWPAAGTGLVRCPWRIRRASRWMMREAGRWTRRRPGGTGATGRGGRSTWSWRRCLHAGRRPIVRFRKCEPQRPPRYAGPPGTLSGGGAGHRALLGGACWPARRGVLVPRWPNRCGWWLGCRYSAL
jgi:hypothetical protein